MTLTTEMPTQPSFQLPAGHHCLDLCSVLWTVHSPQVVLTLSWRNKSMMAHRYYPNLIQRIHCWIPSASTGLGKYLSNEWMNEWKNAFSLLPPPPHPNSLPSGLSTSAKDTAILLQSSKPKGGDLSLDTPSLMWLLKWHHILLILPLTCLSCLSLSLQIWTHELLAFIVQNCTGYKKQNPNLNLLEQKGEI